MQYGTSCLHQIFIFSENCDHEVFYCFYGNLTPLLMVTLPYTRRVSTLFFTNWAEKILMKTHHLPKNMSRILDHRFRNN